MEYAIPLRGNRSDLAEGIIQLLRNVAALLFACPSNDIDCTANPDSGEESSGSFWLCAGHQTQRVLHGVFDAGIVMDEVT